MTSQDEIIAALNAEKHKILSMTVVPDNVVTAEDIVADMQDQANPGRGNQKVSANSRMGAPKPPVGASEVSAEEVKNFFDIPGLKKMLQQNKR
tara:strand:+ start:104 stop:382 length:279 start_codon:yes stop_codon:yes gene_type:complete